MILIQLYTQNGWKMPSLSFRICLGVLAIKGIKKGFSKDPVDPQFHRKGNKNTPPFKRLKNGRMESVMVGQTRVTQFIPSKGGNQSLVLYFHGGAFISGPSDHHWQATKKLFDTTKAQVWMIHYPLAPESKIDALNEQVDLVFEFAKRSFDPSRIIIAGDSAGGTICLSLLQRLVKKSLPLPAKAILICPVLDCSLEHPDVDKIEKTDPILSPIGVRSAKRMLANGRDLKDPMLSPLYGSFEGFPPLLVFVGGRDIMCPDTLLAVDRMRKKGVEVDLVYKEEMIHIWPILPFMREAKEAFKTILDEVSRLEN